jgi:hypothetical protein
MSRVSVRATDGSTVEFDDSLQAGSGGQKDVFYSPDKTYVVAWFRKRPDYNSLERLRNIVGPYREKIFHQAYGEYWKGVYRWPERLIIDRDRVGIVVPAYAKCFFFEYGSRNEDRVLGIRNREKEGRWFASAKHQQRHLDPRERGNWLQYVAICIKIARATRRLHAAGLAHSDLSYKNILVDPRSGGACLIDLDGLVVPGKYPPDVLGTPDFIAPEVMRTRHLALQDPHRILPRRESDQHALAVLIYMYLLYRHPLRGGRVLDVDGDPQRGEELEMGERALFIEHPKDRANRPTIDDVPPDYLPYADVAKLPYTALGPHLQPLIERAFIAGLHNPGLRPSADEWETALVKTVDMTVPCENPGCSQQWFPYTGALKPSCPFCGAQALGGFPLLNFYVADRQGLYRFEGQRLVVHAKRYLYSWHAFRDITPNETVTGAQKEPVAYFALRNGTWLCVNTGLDGLREMEASRVIKRGEGIELREGQRILLGSGPTARVVQVQLLGK